MNNALDLSLALFQAKEILDMYMQSSLRIIRTLITHMKIFCKFWKSPTFSNI